MIFLACIRRLRGLPEVYKREQKLRTVSAAILCAVYVFLAALLLQLLLLPLCAALQLIHLFGGPACLVGLPAAACEVWRCRLTPCLHDSWTHSCLDAGALMLLGLPTGLGRIEEA